MTVMNAAQKITSLTKKLHSSGDITEQDSDEIFFVVYKLSKHMLNVDEGLIIALNLLYTEVYNQLEGGRDGNFVTTLPLVPVESRIDTIINKCLELLPWYKKVRYAGLPANVMPIGKLPGKPKGSLPRSFETAEGIRIYRTNRHTNIITAMSDRAGPFQKVSIKVDLNKYSSIDAESSAAVNWWEHYFKEKSGQVSSKIFLSSYNDLWLHAIMKIAEQMRIKPLFIYTCDGGAKIYVNDDDYQKLKPYFDLDILLDMNKYKISAHMYDKSIIDEAVKELKELLQIKLDIIKEVEDDKWSEIIF